MVYPAGFALSSKNGIQRPVGVQMVSRYHTSVDPEATNNAHSLALRMVGWNKRVLELGAASGHMTRAMANQNCRVTAIEYEAEAAVALKDAAEAVIVGDLNNAETLGQVAGTFEVILAGDVLEHLLDPRRVLLQMTDLLAPGGRIVISLPHVAHIDLRLALLEGRFDYSGWGLLDETHIKFFTLKTIKEMVKSAGLTIVDLQRVRIPAFETELKVDRRRVPTKILNDILADPEAETYQFVFTAVRDDGEGLVAQIAERHEALKAENARLLVAKQVEAVRRAELEKRVTRLEQQLTRAKRQHAAAQRRLQRLQNSKVMKYSAPARVVWGRVRQGRGASGE
jgi:2-polyprenyl-3-methyl-5-hydroxy-6-metoxy-1,4-benzoquinol methylase